MIILKLSVILCCGNFFNIVNPLFLYVCRYTNKYYYYYIKVIFKGKSSIPTDDLIPKLVEISTLWHFRLPLLMQMFIKVRDWNAFRDSLISSAEDAEDCVAGLIP